MAIGTAMLIVAASLSLAPASPSAAPPARPSPAACVAAAPTGGGSFSGTVLQVIDGRTLCVAFGPTPDRWLQVRLADTDADTARGALMAAAFAKSLDCSTVSHYRRGVVALCTAAGVPVGTLARDPQVRAQAASWR